MLEYLLVYSMTLPFIVLWASHDWFSEDRKIEYIFLIFFFVNRRSSFQSIEYILKP